MKYKDLIQFEPIETVVQLRESKDQEYAFQLLDTYVTSDRMAEILTDIVFEQLQYDVAADQKGLLVVGNYGTGKSHLMSVIATISDTEGASDHLDNPLVAEHARKIEGKFKVVREEIGASTMSLRDIVCGYIEESLLDMKVDYSFPPADKVRNNKDAFIEMMSAFHEKYPEHGLLVVIDELLDYLRRRNEQEILLDLAFLRELGEICNITRFRFIAGVQEMLFENPRFHFVADELRRVKKRFEEVQIVREDIAYVVSQRILKKDDRQRALIREHLQAFTHLYEDLNSKLEEYVSLFPIHPAYLSTFERVSMAEKREVLKTISQEIKKLYEHDVPTNETGLISFDTYWPYIEADTALRSSPDVREVLSKSQVLQEKIETAYTRPNLKDMAVRIVRALSVHRLTTGDINAKLGLTSAELRDQLFLHTELAEDDSDFLQVTIESALREILKTVSYQYISVNDSNGQYYLDLAKDEPVDDLIEEKAEVLSDEKLDEYYFRALAEVMEKALNATYIGSFKIWKHELVWQSRNTTRLGYLFFGAPNERSTAQPPRDFYVYMLQPFCPPRFKDEEKDDEVFFKLKHMDETFVRVLKLYAAATELEIISVSGKKKLYADKASEYLKQVNRWLRENLSSAFEITYKGKNYKVIQQGVAIPPHASSSEIVDAVASFHLSSWFDEKYPDYPFFGLLRSPLTSANLRDYVQQTIKAIDKDLTQSAKGILSGLVLYSDEKLQISTSAYANWVLGLLEQKGARQVVNRGELVETLFHTQGSKDIELTVKYQMEPELLAVVLAALVYNGSIVLTINGVQYDAMKYEQLSSLPLDQIIEFSHIGRPSGLPIDALNALVDLLELPRTSLHQNMLEHGIKQIQEKAQDLLQKTVTTIEIVRNGVQCWEGAILGPEEQQAYRAQLVDLKEFLETVLIYNTVAKLNNFKYGVEEVILQKKHLDVLNNVKRLQERVSELLPIATYLRTARTYVDSDEDWIRTLDSALVTLVEALKSDGEIGEQLQILNRLKDEYIEMYLELHEKSRLNATEDNKKNALLQSPIVNALKQLSTIELLPKNVLDEKLNALASLATCWSLTKEKLQDNPYCSSCNFDPKLDRTISNYSVDEFKEQFQNLLDQWTESLINNFNDPELKDNIELLSPEQQKLLNSLLESNEFDLPIDVKLLQAIKELLGGIEKVEITMEDVLQLVGNGNPLTVDELRSNLENLIRTKVKNSSSKKVRIMLKR